MAASNLTKVGVFYDGNFFFHVSNYYSYHHDRRARISVGGLHEFVRQQVADLEGTDPRFCQIVDAHYFRGRVRAQDATPKVLQNERAFDDVLVGEGVVTHYLPLTPAGEKGIDVWFALEAYELAIHKRFDVVVLVAGDGDFLPLVRKLNTLGTRVMLLAWDFRYQDDAGQDRETRTSQILLDEVSYPVMMHQVIDDRSKRNDTLVNGLFVRPREGRPSQGGALPQQLPAAADGKRLEGTIQHVKPDQGYGFITPALGGPNMFFHHTAVEDAALADLKVGGPVSYVIGHSEKGPVAAEVRLGGPATA